MNYIQSGASAIVIAFAMISSSTQAFAYNDYLDRAIVASKSIYSRPVITAQEAKRKIADHLTRGGATNHALLVNSIDPAIIELVRRGHLPSDLGLTIRPPEPRPAKVNNQAGKAGAPTQPLPATTTAGAPSPDGGSTDWVTMGQN